MDRHLAQEWLADLAAQDEPLQLPAPLTPPAVLERVNPTCGDRVQLALHQDASGLHLRGSTQGCVLSTAATTVIASALENAAAEDARARVQAALGVRLHADEAVLSGDLGELAALELVPLRRRCVALPWQVALELLGRLQPPHP